MKFKYKKFKISPSPAFPERNNLLRPIIPIIISYNDRKIGYEALIDSGADICIFHAEVGEFLGIPILEAPKEKFGGIIGREAVAHIRKVDVIIGGNLFSSIPIGFSYDLAPHGYGILGQHGFFDIFKVIFKERADRIKTKALKTLLK